MSKILLFNPRARTHNARVPNSILQIAASIEGKYNYIIVDGNLESNPLDCILKYINENTISVFACTVMPGPQLKQAIPISKKIRELFPQIKIIWGGYFPSNQPATVLKSGYVDFIVNGMGDTCFPQLINSILSNTSFKEISNLIYINKNELVFTKKDAIYELDTLPQLPFEKLNTFYPLQKYLGKTYLGTKTLAYHSSFGCPFTCSFCAVVPIYNARWKGKSAHLIYKDVIYLKEKYGVNAIEFHDNNFFVSEKRVVEFANLIKNENMIWWGEARIDTMNKYSDESLKLIKDAGCKMIFFGAETGNDKVLKKMDKGGTQSAEQILSFAARLKTVGIIPEYSFVLGTPAETEEEVNQQIDSDIEFIRKVKQLNPDTEIIIYTYSPVPTEGSELFELVKNTGFKFPEKLEDWISAEWENFDLRKNPLTPWLKPYMIDKIKNFESVLHARYPTVSDIKLTPFKQWILKLIGIWRYNFKFYALPKEIRLLQRVWKYRQPEAEGF